MKRFELEDAEKIIDQPIEGLLYDLNMLPEVLATHKKEHTKEWICMQIITALKKRNDRLTSELDSWIKGETKTEK